MASIFLPCLKDKISLYFQEWYQSSHYQRCPYIGKLIELRCRHIIDFPTNCRKNEIVRYFFYVHNSSWSNFWYSDMNIYCRFWTMYSTTGNRSDWVFDYMKTVSLHLSSYRVILIIWVLGLSLAIPPLVGWNHYSPEPNGLRYAH